MAGLGFSATQTWNGGALDKAVRTAGQRGTKRAAERLRALSVPLAPLAEGPLRESASVQTPATIEPEASVVYDTPYAVRQHEELDYVHTDGQAKYLEEPLEENRSELMAIVAHEMRIGITNA